MAILAVQVDENGDIPESGPVLVEGPEAVRGMILYTIQCNRGEWPFDLTFGMPWFDEVFGRFFGEGETVQLLTDVIRGVPGVESVLPTAVQITRETAPRRAVITISDARYSGTRVAGTNITIPLESQ